jgi:hypothetical protein
MGLTNAEWEELCLAKLQSLEGQVGKYGLPVGLGKEEARAWHTERTAKPAIAALVELDLLKAYAETDPRGLMDAVLAGIAYLEKQLMSALKGDPCKKPGKKSAAPVAFGSGISRICIPKIPVPPPPPPPGLDPSRRGGAGPVRPPGPGPGPVAGPRRRPARQAGGKQVGRRK